MGYIVKATGGADIVAADPRGVGTSDSLAAQVTEILVAARVAADAEWAEARDAAPILARKMAEKIIGRAVELDAGVMGEIVEQALRACPGHANEIRLRVHPAELVALEQSRPGWFADEGARDVIRFVADETVGRHGCVVETAAGRVDARLVTQLGVLEGVLGGGQGGA